MTVRPIILDDFKAIDHLNKFQDFKLKTLGNSIIDRIVYNGDDLVAYGICKRQAEVIILTNPEISLISRAKAMNELMKVAEFGAVSASCEQLHAFVENEKLARTLEKHYGFVRTKDIVLCKNL